jgi:hypothetical protein
MQNQCGNCCKTTWEATTHPQKTTLKLAFKWQTRNKWCNNDLPIDSVYCIWWLCKQYTALQKVPTGLLISKLLTAVGAVEKTTWWETRHPQETHSNWQSNDVQGKNGIKSRNLPINWLHCIQALGKQYTTLQRVPTGLLISKLLNQRCTASMGSASSTQHCKNAYKPSTLKIAKSALVLW